MPKFSSQSFHLRKEKTTKMSKKSNLSLLSTLRSVFSYESAIRWYASDNHKPIYHWKLIKCSKWLYKPFFDFPGHHEASSHSDFTFQLPSVATLLISAQFAHNFLIGDFPSCRSFNFKIELIQGNGEVSRGYVEI